MNDLQEIGTSVCTVTEVKTTLDGACSIKISIPATSTQLAQELLARYLRGDTNVFVSFIDQHGSKVKETPSIYDL